MLLFFFFKQKTAYEMRISDWSSDVCSSDLPAIDATASNCNPLFWAVQLGVSVLRCAHVVDDDGTFPTGPEMTADALAMNRDAALLETAIRCCWVPVGLGKKMIQQWTPKETERSEEHTSELQSLMRISYAVF